MIDLKLCVPDPSLDLVLDRFVDVSVDRVWAAWTQPELLVQWFTPLPWKTASVEIELWPGGKFKTVMESPDGELMDFDPGCILEVVDQRKFVWTSALLPGYRPKGKVEGEFLFTAEISMLPENGGTRYRAVAIHDDVEGCRQHESMGFHGGWSTALDQLIELVK